MLFSDSGAEQEALQQSHTISVHGTTTGTRTDCKPWNELFQMQKPGHNGRRCPAT